MTFGFGFKMGHARPKGGGEPDTIVVGGVTYTRLYSRSNQPLYSRTTGQPLYGRA